MYVDLWKHVTEGAMKKGRKVETDWKKSSVGEIGCTADDIVVVVVEMLLTTRGTIDKS